MCRCDYIAMQGSIEMIAAPQVWCEEQEFELGGLVTDAAAHGFIGVLLQKEVG